MALALLAISDEQKEEEVDRRSARSMHQAREGVSRARLCGQRKAVFRAREWGGAGEALSIFGRCVLVCVSVTEEWTARVVATREE
jgi:hypothetical protein